MVVVLDHGHIWDNIFMIFFTRFRHPITFEIRQV